MDPAVLALMFPMPSQDPSVTRTVISSIWVMASISTIFLWLRVYCRISYAGKLWWDDVLLITGWALLIISVGLQTRIFLLGYLVTAFGGPEIGPMNLASDTFMKLALAFSKTSFALTVLRIATGWTRYVIYFVAFVMNAAMLIHAVLVWRGNCGTPTPWTFEPCWSPDSGIYMNMIGSIISAFTDFVLALLPIQVIMGLQMKKIEKIGVAVAMSLGFLAGAVSIIKAVEAFGLAKTVGTAFSYRLARLSILIHAEPNAAIVASSIPVLRILLRDIVRQYGSYGTPGAGGKSSPYIKSSHHSTFHGHKGTSSAVVTAMRPDDGSETSILSDQKGQGIHQTRQVAVEYDASSESREYNGPVGRSWRPEAIEMGKYATTNKQP
ncbi:hypothetical protein QBC34DRAFT_297507 [Podospora aff. communis PSN243]|uniref:Rhodopsin domain-containing protein n=1 Tax=Podospora aff. communis PSN243 TaxID=3040156 RepID=A0AAV9GRH5_9PEZI|nr:hypothetical protein QBC34DRAFT_297507 [Podospora aff. communis PSN243]